MLLCLGLFPGCGKKESQTATDGKRNPANSSFKLDNPMAASVGVGGPPRGSRNRGEGARAIDEIAAPAVPTDLTVPDSPIELVFRPASDAGARFESTIIRELEDDDGIFSRKDILELRTQYAKVNQDESAADDQRVAAEIRADRVYVRYEGPRGSNEFDTVNAIAYSGPLAKSLTPTLQSLIDDRIVASVDRRGRFIELQLPSGFEEEIAANPDVIQYGFAKPFVHEFASQLTVPLPEQAVSVGDEWESDSGWSRYGPDIKLQSKYRLEGLSDRDGRVCAVISFETKISGETDQRTSFKAMDYTLQGVAYVDRESGELVYMTNEANGETTFEIEDEELVTFALRFRARIAQVAS